MALDKDGDKLLDRKTIHHLRKLVEELAGVIDQQNIDEIDSVNKRLGQASADFAAMRMDASVKEALSGRHFETVAES